MVQKSGVHQLRLVVYPIIYRVLYIQPVVGLGISQPSTSPMGSVGSMAFPQQKLNQTVSNLQAFGHFPLNHDYPKCSMYRIFTYMFMVDVYGFHVGKYTIHGAYGYWRKVFFFWANFPIIPKSYFLWIWGRFPILKHHLGWPTGGEWSRFVGCRYRDKMNHQPRWKVAVFLANEQWTLIP